jgi:hypothetical protein
MRIGSYRNYFNDIIESNQIKDLKKFFIRYKEEKTFQGVLKFNFENLEWEIIPNSYIVNEKGVSFDLMRMIYKHEDIGPLLSFLIKDHTYSVIFQIPEFYENYNVYAFLEENEVGIKILDEYDERGKILKETCFDNEKMVMPLYDIEDVEHLYRILEKLDSISSGYVGVELIDYENNKLISIFSHSAILLDKSYEDISIHGPENFCFELIKRNEMTIYNEIYEDEIIKKASDFVLNTVLKTVFGVLIEAMNLANKPVMELAMIKLQKMPKEIRDLYSVTLTILMDSKLSPSVMLWRQMIQRDIGYDMIKQAFDTIH